MAASLLSRPLSTKFSTSHMRRLNHNDVLCEIEKSVDKSCIKSIQIKERECIVTVENLETKNKLITSSTNIQNQQITFVDVDSLITNVTVKDAPYEMPDTTITAHLSQYGEIVHGSLTHGKIKGTTILNGTRYVKILNCVPTLPLNDNIGRFTVRYFADNNRTPCRYCGETSHPYFKCTVERQGHENRIKCWNCKGPHARKDCERDVICRYCEQEGHVAHSCPRKDYGEYAEEIIDGRRENDEGQHEGDEKNQGDITPVGEITSFQNTWTDDTIGPNDTPYTESSQITAGQEGTRNSDFNIDASLSELLTTKRLIIGDSNATRMRVMDTQTKSLSKSGAKLIDVKNVVDAENTSVIESVVLCLGTNDLKNNPRMTVVENALKAIKHVTDKWPEADVAFSSILPRLGNSKPTRKINADTRFVNEEVLKQCQLSKNFHFIDNDEIFFNNGKLSKSLYDAGDPSGVHVNDEGAKKLYDNLDAFLVGGISDEDEMPSVRSKRTRSDGSEPSPSLLRNKQAKS